MSVTTHTHTKYFMLHNIIFIWLFNLFLSLLLYNYFLPWLGFLCLLLEKCMTMFLELFALCNVLVRSLRGHRWAPTLELHYFALFTTKVPTNGEHIYCFINQYGWWWWWWWMFNDGVPRRRTGTRGHSHHTAKVPWHGGLSHVCSRGGWMKMLELQSRKDKIL